jgi:hypothetical protein
MSGDDHGLAADVVIRDVAVGRRRWDDFLRSITARRQQQNGAERHTD